MKKIAICTLLSFLALQSNSQITKGNWMIGGNGNFSLTTYNSEAGQRNTGFTIQASPNIGYFIAGKFVTGLRVGFGKQGSKATGTSRFSTYTDANFGPFFRYYFLPNEHAVNIIADGSYQYGYIAGDNNKAPKNTFSFLTGPVVYFNTSTALEFLIGYSSSKYVGYSGSNGTLQVGLGLQFYLERDN